MYRLLLWLAFPRRLRRAFGDDMARLFEAQRAEVRAAGGSVARLWIQAIWDAAAQGSAERMAAIENGGMALVREVRRWRWWMRALIQDTRYALRLFVRQPGVTLVAILTLALGIGGNTAIFSAVDAVLLRPLPYPEPDHLVKVWETRRREGTLNNVVSTADFLDWSRMNGAFEVMAAQMASTVDLTGRGEPVRLRSGVVSPAFFDVLRVSPAIGRPFRPEEGTFGRHRVVILGHGLWQRQFGSDPAIVGARITLHGHPHEVIGVLPATFEFPGEPVDLWVPLALDGSPDPPSRTQHSFEVYARLKHGVTLERARAEMDRVASALSEQYPDANRHHGAYVSPLHDEFAQPARTGLLLLLGAVAFVLLIACVNVANLLMARAASRRREMAVRAALGAGRGRVAVQSLTESAVLGLLGGAAGLIVARWGIGLMRALAPENLPVLGVHRIGLDPRVLAFTLLLSVITGLIFGLLPAWHAASQDLNASLKDGGRTAGGVRRRLRTTLVVAEIALASLLLVGAGLTLRSFQSLLASEPGIRTDGVLSAFVALPPSRYSAPNVAFDEIERRFAGIAGVKSVGATAHLPLTGQDSRGGVRIEFREPSPDMPTRAHLRAATPGYFKTMGIQLLEGRTFTDADRDGAPLVAVINETMAKRYWPGQSAVGKRFYAGGSPGQWREVVGVIRDVKHWGLDLPVNPEYFLPQQQFPWQRLTFVLATDRDPAALAGAVREQLRAVDPDLPLSNVRTMADVAARSVASRRATMILLAVFGTLALVLAAAGIYGVMAQLVALRTSEIGVRMTLGARPRDVMRLVLREGLFQAVIGLAIGISAGVLLMRSFRTLLYGIEPADPVTLSAVAAILTCTALAACLVPARRAMSVDPVQALREG